ncbi:MAG: alpha/beta hydrolase [Gemmatales bacterium]|nr:alpha/beta hydrolase [Gemmatales bacterium]MDW7993268.1 alpha/beta hydrolase [Gemmatales bacterium]
MWRILMTCLLIFPAVSWTWCQEKPKPKPPAVPPDTQVLRDLEYVPEGHERHKLDLYLPQKANKPMPLIVWIHGGGWRGGSKDNPPTLWLAERGYALASINYRLSQHATFPAQIHDCKAAIRWLRAHASKYDIDPNRIGVIGASAGGHLAALLGAGGDIPELEGNLGLTKVSSRVQAVCDIFGPTDFLRFEPMNRDPKSVLAQLLGGTVEEKKELARLASPVTHASKDDPPFLILHGTADKVVPLAQSEYLENALRGAGVEVTLIRIDNAGHGGPQFNTPEIRKTISDFFDKHLRAVK